MLLNTAFCEFHRTYSKKKRKHCADLVWEYVILGDWFQKCRMDSSMRQNRRPQTWSIFLCTKFTMNTLDLWQAMEKSLQKRMKVGKKREVNYAFANLTSWQEVSAMNEMSGRAFKLLDKILGALFIFSLTHISHDLSKMLLFRNLKWIKIARWERIDWKSSFCHCSLKLENSCSTFPTSCGGP